MLNPVAEILTWERVWNRIDGGIIRGTSQQSAQWCERRGISQPKGMLLSCRKSNLGGWQQKQTKFIEIGEMA